MAAASLADYPGAVAEGLRAAITGLRTVEPYAGQFTATSPERVSFTTPALLVAISDAPVSDPGTGELDLKLKVTVYVCAQSMRGTQDRSHSAAALAEKVALTARSNSWGLAPCTGAEITNIQPLHSNGLDKQGMALYAVTWRQSIRVGESAWDGTDVIPTEVYASMEPDIGTAHIDDYEEITRDSA
jgi:hypothetical protein